MKALHTIIRKRSAVKRSKRIGRGNASGKGTYSGRGVKGQRARSGGRSGITARAMKSYLLRIPKKRGFGGVRFSYEIINLSELQKHFEDGARVTALALRKKGLLRRKHYIKILGDGQIAKRLHVTAHSISARAKELIEKAGGSITLQKPIPDTTQKKGSK